MEEETTDKWPSLTAKPQQVQGQSTSGPSFEGRQGLLAGDGSAAAEGGGDSAAVKPIGTQPLPLSRSLSLSIYLSLSLCLPPALCLPCSLNTWLPSTTVCLSQHLRSGDSLPVSTNTTTPPSP